MIGRKQELNLQFQQILDGALLVLAFWAAHVIRTSLGLLAIWIDATYHTALRTGWSIFSPKFQILTNSAGSSSS